MSDTQHTEPIVTVTSPSYTLDAADRVHFRKYHAKKEFRKKPWTLVWLIFMVITYSYSEYIRRSRGVPFDISETAIPIAVLLYFILMWSLRASNSRKLLKAGGRKSQSIAKIDPDCLQIEQAGSISRFDWKKVTSIEADKRLFYFFVTSSAAALIKRDAFESLEAAERFLEHARSLHMAASVRPVSASVLQPTLPEGPSERAVFQLTQRDLKNLHDLQAKSKKAKAQRLITWAIIFAFTIPVTLAVNYKMIFVYHAYIRILPALIIMIVSIGILGFMINPLGLSFITVRKPPFNAPQSATVRKQGIQWTDCLATADIGWSRIKQIENKKDAIYLVFENLNLIGIPASAFRSPMEKDAFYSRMRSYWKGLGEPEIAASPVDDTVWPPRPR